MLDKRAYVPSSKRLQQPSRRPLAPGLDRQVARLFRVDLLERDQHQTTSVSPSSPGEHLARAPSAPAFRRGAFLDLSEPDSNAFTALQSGTRPP
jgi:hypothetical protein